MGEYIALIRFFYFRGCPEKLDKVMDIELYHTLKDEIGFLADVGVIKFGKDVQLY